MSNEVSVQFERFNQAADNNKQVILDALRPRLIAGGCVLEIGSGSGQHAAFFTAALPAISWQPTDMAIVFGPLQRNLSQLSRPGLLPAMPLDIADFQVTRSFEYVYCANVLHIMSADLIEPLFKGVSNALLAGGTFLAYGPFKYRGDFTTPSNARFDAWLREQNPDYGIRDIEALVAAAERHGMQLIEDVALPANNQLLVFKKAQSSENFVPGA